MGSVEVGQLINTSLRGDDPYCRLDVFFRNRLSLRPNATPPARLPDNFMELYLHADFCQFYGACRRLAPALERNCGGTHYR